MRNQVTVEILTASGCGRRAATHWGAFVLGMGFTVGIYPICGSASTSLPT